MINTYLVIVESPEGGDSRALGFTDLEVAKKIAIEASVFSGGSVSMKTIGTHDTLESYYEQMGFNEEQIAAINRFHEQDNSNIIFKEV